MINRTEIKKKVDNLLTAITGKEKFVAETLLTDLKMKENDIAEFIAWVSNEFKIEIAEEKLILITSVQHIYSIVEAELHNND